MDRLISINDFIMQQNMHYANKDITVEKLQLRILNYALFLKQPLTLGMFVPCDLDGKVLEEPNIVNDHHGSFFKMQTDFQEEKQYLEAEERVLFPHFSIQRKPFEDFDFVINDKLFVFKKYCTMKHWSINTKTKKLEDLVKYNLTLTESAKKQIGL